MTGQGRPRTSWNVARRVGGVGTFCRAVFVALAACSAAAAAPETRPAADVISMQLRIAWGGGPERLWEGTISVRGGALTHPRLLGLEADEPGSIWVEDGRLVVRQRSPRGYDGVDVTVDAPADAKLLVKLSPVEGGEPPPPIEIPLAELANDFRNLPLDGRGNHVLVRRTPGDQLRVRLAGDALVFSPGEKLRLEVEPCVLPAPADAKLTLRCSCRPADKIASCGPRRRELRTAAAGGRCAGNSLAPAGGRVRRPPHRDVRVELASGCNFRFELEADGRGAEGAACGDRSAASAAAGQIGRVERRGRDRLGQSAMVGLDAEAAALDAADALEQDLRGQRRDADHAARAGRVDRIESQRGLA